LFYRYLILFLPDLFVALAVAFLGIFQRSHARFHAVFLQDQAITALDSFERLGDAVDLVQIGTFEIGPLLEILSRFRFTPQLEESQSAEVVTSRIVRPAFNGVCQVLMRLDVVSREVRMDSGSVHLSQQGVLGVG